METFFEEFVCFVKVTTEDGSFGWGQTSTNNADITAQVFHRQIAPSAPGAESAHTAHLIKTIERREHRYPGTYRCRAPAGNDTALWDLHGRRAGKPVVELLWGNPARSVPHVTRFFRPLSVDEVRNLHYGDGRSHISCRAQSLQHACRLWRLRVRWVARHGNDEQLIVEQAEFNRSSTSCRAAARYSVAPMMDWTDRHCRYFHRQMSRHSLLYTEMVTAQAIIHGPRDRLLAHHAAEHPVALQLGGADPAYLAEAVRLAAPYGYDEINLNVGCPSDRVKSGCFGAVLMKSPDLVAECVAAMIVASSVEVTVKCRIGVDDQNPEEVLPDFLEKIAAAGVRRVTIHARKAWLQGLSPKENREIPPLDYPLVLAMKRAFPDLHISINGGINSLEQAKDLLSQGLDGVMIGRAAYHEPWSVLARADSTLFDGGAAPGPDEVIARMRSYIESHLSSGGRLHQITRHMLGLFHGRPGARSWRRILSERANADGAGQEVLDAALEQVAIAA